MAHVNLSTSHTTVTNNETAETVQGSFCCQVVSALSVGIVVALGILLICYANGIDAKFIAGVSVTSGVTTASVLFLLCRQCLPPPPIPNQLPTSKETIDVSNSNMNRSSSSPISCECKKPDTEIIHEDEKKQYNNISMVMWSLSQRLMGVADENKDYVHSVVTIMSVIMQAAEAMDSESSANLMKELFFSGSLEEARNDYKKMLSTLKSFCEINNTAILKTEDCKTQEYTSIIKKSYNTEITFIKKQDTIDTIVSNVNNIISKQTQGMCQNAISKQFLTPFNELVAILISTLYFQKNWEEKFEAKNTGSRPFTTFEKKTMMVDKMWGASNCQFYTGSLPDKKCPFDLVGKAYEKGRGVHWILISKKIEDQKTVEKYCNQHPEFIEKCMQEAKKQPVFLILPKYTIRHEIDQLINKLIKINIPGIEATLEKLQNAKIQKAKTVTIMTTDEKGSEAASYTAMAGSKSNADSPPIVKVSHPFVGWVTLPNNVPILSFALRDCRSFQNVREPNLQDAENYGLCL